MSTIYKVTCPNPATGRTEVRWAGSMAQVREYKAELLEKTCAGAKKKDAKHTEEEIAFSKAGVMEFLNQHATKA